jgi:predicted DNA-binding transcriptional regulator AlpA
MAERSKLKQRNALKHGAYSTIGLLPGESPALFKKYQKVVVDEFRPNGLVELDIVLTIARLLWRKENLASFETAKLVNYRFRQIFEEEKQSRGISQMFVKGENHAALEEAWRAAQTKARSELGDWDWDEFLDNKFGTIERLKKDLELLERLDAIIEKGVKRLLMVRGVKSMALAPPLEPPQIHKPRDVNRPAKDRVQGQASPEAAATVQGQGPRESAHSTENREVRDQARPDPPDLIRYLSATQVCLRHGGQSLTWLQRLMERDPTFPKPIMPGRHRLWALPELETWERRQAAGDAMKTKNESPGAGPTARGASAEIPNGGGAEDRLNPGQGTAEPTLVPPPHEFRILPDNN